MRRLVAALLLLVSFLAVAPAGSGVNVWTPIGPDGGGILSLAVDPRRPGVLFAGTEGSLFKSSDGGATWHWSSRGLRNNAVLSLAVAPSRSAVVYAGTRQGVFVSKDGGATWQGTGLSFLVVLALAVDPHDSRRVWAGTSNGLLRSSDAGAHWVSASGTEELLARVIDVALDPADPDTVYAAVDAMEDIGVRGVVKSTDAGATWRLVDAGLDPNFNQDSVRLAVDPEVPGLLYVSFLSGFGGLDRSGVTYRSTNGGATWEITDGGYPVAVDANGVVYAGDRRSIDRGATWQTTAVPPDTAMRFAASRFGGGTLWAGTERLGVFRSRDRAATWENASRGLHATSVLSLAIDPERPRILYAGTFRSGIYKTLSTGARWRPIEVGLPSEVNDFFGRPLLALDPLRPATLYLAWTSSQGFARSDDGGEHWTVLRDEDDSFHAPRQIVPDPAVSGTVFLVGDNIGTNDGTCRVARSLDRGTTWRCLPPFGFGTDLSPSARMVADPGRPGTFWLLDRRDRFWKSTDHGTTWKAIRVRGLEKAGEPSALLIDPAQPRRLFLGTQPTRFDDRAERVWRSDDDGLTWRAWGRGFPSASRIDAVRIDPRQPSILYAAVETFGVPSGSSTVPSGVYWSRNGGHNFFPMAAGLPGQVLQLEMDPKDPRRLYAATANDGIYTFTRQ